MGNIDIEVPTTEVPITKVPSVPGTQPNPEPAPTQLKLPPEQETENGIKPEPKTEPEPNPEPEPGSDLEPGSDRNAQLNKTQAYKYWLVNLLANVLTHDCRKH